MRKISTFTFMSVDGFYAGPQGEIDWFKMRSKDDEYDAFTHKSSKTGNTLILGHTTYEMMRSFWPTPEAIKTDPDMAQVMNNSRKIVFSRTLKNVQEEPRWKNITIMHEIIPEEITRLKAQVGDDITILGSGTIIQELGNLGLIDEYELLVIPVILGSGKALFKDAKKMSLKLLEARSFENGIVWLRYQSRNIERSMN